MPVCSSKNFHKTITIKQSNDTDSHLHVDNNYVSSSQLQIQIYTENNFKRFIVVYTLIAFSGRKSFALSNTKL